MSVWKQLSAKQISHIFELKVFIHIQLMNRPIWKFCMLFKPFWKLPFYILPWNLNNFFSNVDQQLCIHYRESDQISMSAFWTKSLAKTSGSDCKNHSSVYFLTFVKNLVIYFFGLRNVTTWIVLCAVAVHWKELGKTSWWWNVTDYYRINNFQGNKLHRYTSVTIQ